MPDKVADDAERELYLTPGGIYTQADIEANGNLTASQKFKGFMAKHDMHPKPGSDPSGSTQSPGASSTCIAMMMTLADCSWRMPRATWVQLRRPWDSHSIRLVTTSRHV